MKFIVLLLFVCLTAHAREQNIIREENWGNTENYFPMAVERVEKNPSVGQIQKFTLNYPKVRNSIAVFV